MKSGEVVQYAGAALRVAVVTLLPLLTFSAVGWVAESPEKMETRRLAEQARTYRVVNKDYHNLPIADGPQDRLNNWMAAQAASRSIIQDNYVAHTGLGVTSAAPGLKVASTTYDFQHNDAAPHQIATNGSGRYTHFVWTHGYVIPDSNMQVDRFVNFNTYNSSGAGWFLHGVTGGTISGGGGDPSEACGGFAGLDIDKNDRAKIAFHQRDAPDQPSGDYSSWVLPQSTPNFSVFTEDPMFGSKGVLGNPDDDIVWPHLTVDQIVGSADMIHVLGHTYSANNNITYWRFQSTDVPQWKGPYVVDSCSSFSYQVACDRGSSNAALITENDEITGGNPNGLLQVVYRESSTNGDDWGPVNTDGLGDAKRLFITNYNLSTGPQAWLEVVGDYDNAGNLHAVWNEQRFANTTEQVAWKHWDKASGTISTIHLACWDNKGSIGARDLNLAFPTIGFGDGSTTCGAGTNLNFIYMTFVQFGGPTLTEQYDYSSRGYMNGEIYLSVSNNGGLSWAPAMNLTNSMFPGCNPATSPMDSCPSENWPSIARTVDDSIHIMYINDRDAGDAVFGQGVWTYNPVMYYRIPGGTNAKYLCPLISPNFAAALSDANGGECEYNTPPNTNVNETLTLSNVGNAAMTGTVSSTGAFLTVTGAGPYTIPAGGANLTYPVTMAGSATEGLLSGSISITHNDSTKTSPYVIPVDLFVFTNFACPQYVVLHTRWLELEVSNIERLAVGPSRSGSKLRGLYRPPRFGQADSGNNSIYDASLIIARPPIDITQPPDGILDTVVYRYLFGTGNYAKGFRALSNLQVDTSRYGTGSGIAYARANQTTVDSIIGVDVEYQFPQHTDSSNFVLINYKIFNRTASSFSGLIVGEAVDFDIIASTQYGIYQIASQNKAGYNTSMNLLYQQGADSGNTIYAQKYLGGMTAIQCTQAPRAWIKQNDPWLFQSPCMGGFCEGYLYRELVKSGFEIIQLIPPTGGVDLHSVMAFEKNVTLDSATVKHYTLGFVTSTAGPDTADLMATTRQAWRFAFGWQDVVDYDTVSVDTPMSYPYWASGSHENGPSSGCCGCVVSKVSGSSLLTIAPDAGNCTGTINFAGTATLGIYTATFRLTTPVCGGPTYTEDHTIRIVTAEDGCCNCPSQGDVNSDNYVDVFDVMQEIAIAFRGGVDIMDPVCPRTRGDVDNSGYVDVFDVIRMIAMAWSGGSVCNPCTPGVPAGCP